MDFSVVFNEELRPKMRQPPDSEGVSFKFVVWGLVFVHFGAFLYWLYLFWRSNRESFTESAADQRSIERLDSKLYKIRIPDRFPKVPGTGKKKYNY